MDSELRAIEDVREFAAKLGIPEPPVEFREHVVPLPSGSTWETPVAFVYEERDGPIKRRLSRPELRISPKALESMSNGELRFRIARALADNRRRPRAAKMIVRAAAWTVLPAAVVFASGWALGIRLPLEFAPLVSVVLLLVCGAAVTRVSVLRSMRKAMKSTLEIADMTGEYDAALTVNEEEIKLFERLAPGRQLESDLASAMAQLKQELEKRRSRSSAG